jgi:hypothetical protein
MGFGFDCHDDVGMGNRDRSGYQTDVNDEEWGFVAPFLTLCREDSAQRVHPLRSVFNALRYVAKTGLPLAIAAQRSASLDGGVPADAPLDGMRAVSRLW